MSQNSWSRIPYRVRQQIKTILLARDGLRCCRCRLPMNPREATIEHLKPRSQGGALTDYSNLGLSHPSCNYSRRYDQGARVVDGVSFFTDEAPEHPAPHVFPSPEPTEKPE